MAPTKKRKTARKSVSTTKPAKRRSAGKRGIGGSRKGLVMDVVHQLEPKLEEISKTLRKTAKKTKKAAARNKVVANVVHALESVPKKIRKAATAKKRGRRV